eukprot:647285-Pelagomonas_calceolata.AAC.1
MKHMRSKGKSYLFLFCLATCVATGWARSGGIKGENTKGSSSLILTPLRPPHLSALPLCDKLGKGGWPISRKHHRLAWVCFVHDVIQSRVQHFVELLPCVP